MEKEYTNSKFKNVYFDKFDSELSIEEQKECFNIIRNCDDKNKVKIAKDKFIMSYQKLINMIGKKYEIYVHDFMEIISAGNLGLIKAIENYDSTLDTEFRSYCCTYIKGYILNYLRSNKYCNYDYSLYKKYLKEKQDLINQLGYEPDDRLIASAMEIDPEQLSKVILGDRFVVSLNEPIGNDNLTIEDSICKSDIYDEIEHKELKNILDKILDDILDEEQKAFIKKIYCLDYNGLSESSKKYDLNSILRKLRIMIDSDVVEGYYNEKKYKKNL